MRTTTIYARQSLDRSALAAGVTRQLSTATERCRLSDWRDPVVYVDNDISATNGDRRPEYERLLEDIAAGRVERVVVFHLSRLWRNRQERASGIELMRRQGTSVVCVQGPDIDMTSAYGRGMAAMLGEVDTLETELKSERQLLANAQRAEAGLPHGGGPRAFGFLPDGLTLIPVEADAIKAAYAVIVSGGSLRSIAKSWNVAGLFSGKPRWGTVSTRKDHPQHWDGSGVRDVLASARYMGVRRYNGVDYIAAWPALVDEATWQAAQAIFADPARRPAARHYGTGLLSTVAFCGVCTGPVHQGGGGRRGKAAEGTVRYSIYRCATHSGKHIARRADHIDDYVARVVIERLSRPDAIDLIETRTGPNIEALRVEREALRQRSRSLAATWATDLGMSPEQFVITNRTLADRLAEIDDKLADAGRASVLGPLVGADDVRAVWDVLDVDRRRAVITELMTVTLDPVGQGTRTFRPESVRITPRRSDTAKLIT